MQDPNPQPLVLTIQNMWTLSAEDFVGKDQITLSLLGLKIFLIKPNQIKKESENPDCYNAFKKSDTVWSFSLRKQGCFYLI